MASRRKGRILAFQGLYSWEANRVSAEEIAGFFWLEPEKRAALDEATGTFSRLLIVGTIENIEEIDRTIQDHLKNWDLSRLNRVDLAVLRLSTYTLMYQDDVPPSIVIDEAIGISKEFGTDESFRFINGVLDSIRKTLQSNSAQAAVPGPDASPESKTSL
ncbi:transcription antitermination factor NusB [Breznakiella homolactica]|uniref:Transcription antitermination protein NusB n=1 Tax=Breznakiella homolactica TaxID=2798577 RepID=A0A7T7XMV9_9SPIR|nr:transcription antitermination factor NusB [Breznakiella homolactica]QQO09286.1 transcription antitermination factor NusB [Breznakiella homolactica]